MKNFLEQYGISIFTLIIIAILIAFVGSFGNIIKTATNNQVKNIDHISTLEIQKASTPVSEYVYACLYNNGNLVLSSHEIKNKENVMIDYGKTKTHPWTGTIENPNTTVKTVTFLDVVKLTNCNYLFSCCECIETIENMEYLDTSECVSIAWMFNRCRKLKNIDLSNFNTSKVSSMNGMFVCCKSLTTLDLSSFDTSNVVSMNWIFDCCSNLKSINLSSFNTSKVQGMQDMFLSCLCLTTLNLSSFDTSNCTNMNNMFFNCTSLRTITVSDTWNTSHATTENMFQGCAIDHVSYK